MFKGLKHALKCIKCNKVVYLNSYGEVEEYRNRKSDCCNVEYEYIGFQPVYDNIVKFSVVLEEDEEEDTIDIKEMNEVMEDGIEEIEEVAVEVENEDENEDEDEDKEANTAISGDLKIEDIVDVSKKMNKGIMIALMKEFITNDEKDKLILLQNHYSETYEGSKRYLGKKFNEKLEEMFN